MTKIVYITISFFLFSSCNETPKNANHAKNKFDVTKNCKCFDGIGSSKNDAPKLTHTFKNNKSVSICGFVDKEMQEEGMIISEFDIFDCDNGKSYIQFGALKICRIIEEENELQIQDLKYLPVGKNWNWELIQIGIQTIKPDEKELVVSKLIPVKPNFSIENEQANIFLNSLKPKKGFNSDWEQIIGKLESLSIIGNDKAWNILKNLENFTGLKFDGALKETWTEAVENVKWMKKI